MRSCKGVNAGVAGLARTCNAVPISAIEAAQNRCKNRDCLGDILIRRYSSPSYSLISESSDLHHPKVWIYLELRFPRGYRYCFLPIIGLIHTMSGLVSIARR